MGRKKRTHSGGVVYLISFPNGKKYIGITSTSFEERKQGHLSHMNTSKLPVSNALRKYGEQVIWEVIDKADNWNELCHLEKSYIIKYDSLNNGYNLTAGGDGTVGYEHSEENNIKNSQRRKKFFKNPANRLNQSIASKKAHQKNPEQALNHSKTMSQKFEDPNQRKKVADGMRKFLSNEEALKIHSIQRGAKYFLVHKDDIFIGEWLSQNQCARDLNLSVSHINRCLHNKRKSHKGYIFKYKQKNDV